ncbi:MAG: RnfABCDGE type electron transport complex subunit D [Clostridia bacterium]|nr:RnfABCDGE type electron transport complex subunit D [Clostridia bacterium]
MNNEEKIKEEQALLTVSPSPHIRQGDSTRSVMTDVIIALLPALLWGVICFGLRALAVVLLSVGVAVLSEYGYERLMKKPVTTGDFSAALTGLLLGMTLSPAVPYYIPIVGSVFAIIVVKQLFGGLGKNFMNPALAARVFLFAWPGQMTVFTEPFKRLSIFDGADAIAEITASATPLASLKAETLPDIAWVDIITGRCSGSIGEVSAILLILGGIYLLLRKVITWHIPVSFIGSVLLLTLVFPQNEDVLAFVLSSLFSGGLILGAFFMATDYVTSPITSQGKLIYGALCGAITVFIRYFGGYPEGVSFAVIIMNSMVYYLDVFTRPRVFGKRKRGHGHG